MSPNPSRRPTVLIVSGEEVLKNSLKEELKRIECLVDVKDHRESSVDTPFSPHNYFIWITGKLGLVKESSTEFSYIKDSLSRNINKLKGRGVKCAFVFPYIEKKENFSRTSELITSVREAGFEKDILIVGDICQGTYEGKRLEEIALGDLYREYFPVELKELTSEIIKSLFTLSEKKPKALISKKFDLGEVKKLIRESNSSSAETNAYADFRKRRVKTKIYLNQNRDELIANLKEITRSVDEFKSGSTFEQRLQEKAIERSQETTRREPKASQTPIVVERFPSKKSETKDRLLRFISGIVNSNFLKRLTPKRKKINIDMKLIALSLPLFMIFIFSSPAVLLKFSEQLLSYDGKTSNRIVENKVIASSTLLNILDGELKVFSKVKFLKSSYQDTTKKAAILQKYKNYSKGSLTLKKQSDKLIKDLFRKSVSTSDLKEIELNLKKLSEDGAFLIGDIANFTEVCNDDEFFYETLVNKVNNSRKQAYLMGEILRNSRELFGFDGVKRYLLVFNDSSMVRPSGGMIKEVALISVSEGRVENIDIFDSGAIRENAKGYAVAPPTLFDYIGGESWSIKDANWSTSYNETSERIRWFMENSVTSNIDGVISFNSKLISDYQEYFATEDGDGYTSEPQTDRQKLTSNQEEGSSVFQKLFSNGFLESEPYGQLTNFLGREIENKNLLIYLSDTEVGNMIDELGWGDSYRFSDCRRDCFNDFIKVVEFELSDTEDVLVRRAGNLNVSIEGGLIKRTYMLTIVNISDEIYKSYLRLSVPQESGFAPARIIDLGGESEEILNIKGAKERKEAGIYFEVDPGENKKLVFSWEGGFSPEIEKLDRYVLNLVKQPGLDEVDMFVKIKYLGEADVVINEKTFLTNIETLLYNSSLLTDEVIKLTFE